MFSKVKLFFASVHMYHLRAFREARVRIFLKNSNLLISTAKVPEKMPRIHNTPKKTVPRTHSFSLLKTFFWIRTCASSLIQGRWFTSTVTLESRNLRAPINHSEMWLFFSEENGFKEWKTSISTWLSERTECKLPYKSVVDWVTQYSDD